MTDSIVHSSIHAGSRALAESLAVRLELRPAPFPTARPPDAALGVAPTSEHRHRSAALPVVILSRRVAMPLEFDGQVILCGGRDERDAPAAATAAAIADSLRLRLALIHVVSPRPATVPGAATVPFDTGLTVADTR